MEKSQTHKCDKWSPASLGRGPKNKTTSPPSQVFQSLMQQAHFPHQSSLTTSFSLSTKKPSQCEPTPTIWNKHGHLLAGLQHCLIYIRFTMASFTPSNTPTLWMQSLIHPGQGTSQLWPALHATLHLSDPLEVGLFTSFTHCTWVKKWPRLKGWLSCYFRISF